MPTDRRNRGSSIGQFYKELYLTNRFFVALAVLVLLAAVCFIFPTLFIVLQLLTLLAVLFFAIDCIALYRTRKGIFASRNYPERLSNGDENQLSITLRNNYPFSIHAEIIEELPSQLQIRDMSLSVVLKSLEKRKINYTLRPVERGVYSFGKLNVFVQTKLSIIKRRYIEEAELTMAVYPSFLEINKYELLAATNRLTDFGIKRIRRIGNATEFEQIKPYVIGDDPRTINYQATARTNELMVNTYVEERSQPIYCLIDKGRTMQMPFDKLTLLDYAINSSLIVSTTALKKSDKAGLITFSNTVDDILPASDRAIQRNRIMETLYKQETDFQDASYSKLFLTIRHTIKQRSLLILFTNFETVNALKRQIKYLRLLAKDHLLLVAFFLNTEMDSLLDMVPEGEEDIFRKGVAEKMHNDKNLIVKELNRYGIHVILSAPKDLSIQSINKYLEMKARGLI